MKGQVFEMGDELALRYLLMCVCLRYTDQPIRTSDEVITNRSRKAIEVFNSI